MFLKPSNIFYSQHQISVTFGKWNRHRNTNIGKTLDDLCEGRCKITDIQPIKVTKRDNKWYALDNRRLWLFHRLEKAGKCTEIPVVVEEYSPSSHGRKFSSNNGGTSVTYIKGRSPEGKWFKRIKPDIPRVQDEGKQNEPKACVKANSNANIGEDTVIATESVASRLEEIEGETSETVIKQSDESCKQRSSINICQIASETESISKENKQDKQESLKGMSVDTGAAKVNRKECQKRLLSNSDFTRTVKHMNTQIITRFKPYELRVSSDRRIHSSYSNNLIFRHQFESKTRKGHLAIFRKSEIVDRDSASSDDDCYENELNMFVDDRETTANEIDETYSDNDVDSKEIDYDDDPWSDEYSNSLTLEYDELDVWESEADEYTAYYHFPDSETDSEEENPCDSSSESEHDKFDEPY